MMAITTSNGSTRDTGASLRRQGAVLVTGASSGIGFATAVRLARHGTIVFAGIRRQSDGENLLREGAGNIRPMLIDVVDHGSFVRARAKIESLREYRLDGLVNNAGIALGGPLELLPMVELRKQFEVNFFGAVAAMQTFLPLLRQSGGRIVNVSSMGGKLAMPFLGAYCASKFALEAASDSLRIELRPFGVDVSVVEPGSVKTPMWRRSAEASLKIMDDVPPGTRSDYDAMIRNVARLALQQESSAMPPELVARVIERALFARRPRARYVVGNDARIRLLVARLPEPLRDLLVTAALGMVSKRGERSLAGRHG